MQRMRRKRLKSGLSIMAVAKELKVSRIAVYLWESGQTLPTAKHLKELAKLYRCTMDELMED